MDHVSELSCLLSGMGKTADEIAATLDIARIRGGCNTARFLNPIVRYCQKHLLVDDYTLDVMQRGKLRIQLPNHVSEDIELPLPVTDFLEAFNKGAYPNLEIKA